MQSMWRTRGVATAALVAGILVPHIAAGQAKKEEEKEEPAIVERVEEMVMALGEQKTISMTGVKNYTVGTPGIAEVRVAADRAVVVGLRAGTTTLVLINFDGSQIKWVINVFQRAPDAVEREVKQLLEGLPGVRVRRVGSRFFIEGGVTTEGDMMRVDRVARLYPGQVESLVVVGAAPFERALNIRVDFFFIQYDRASSWAIGVAWPQRIGGEVIQSEFRYDFLAGAVTSAQAAVVNQPLPALDIASRNGWAKVLRQSTVITTNGSEATFDSGGEQNYSVTAGLTASITPITFGTNVKVLPRYDPTTGNMEVRVSADVSELIPSPTGELPGRTVSRLATLVHMKLGESLILSGIRTRSTRHSISGLPGLSEIPVLGVFFGSHGQQREDTEGAVFIIPSVVESVPRGTLKLVESAMAQYEEFTGDIEAINAYNKRPKLQQTDE